MEREPAAEREDRMYQIWECVARTGILLSSVGGDRILVISQGARNNGAGPDFLDAVLLINGQLRTGAVEMHLRERDWFAHGHQRDPAYKGVILHVLASHDGPARLSIPTLRLDDLLRLESSTLDVEGTFPGFSPDLLAELSWARLLRRVTEVVRARTGERLSDHLRKEFLRRFFDALGYAVNRVPMRELADQLIAVEHKMAGESLPGIMAHIASLSGITPDRFIRAGHGVLSAEQLKDVVAGIPVNPLYSRWRYDVHRSNAPEIRLWGAAILLHEIYQNTLLRRLAETVVRESTEVTAQLLRAQLGNRACIGIGRGREIVVNALIPVVLAAGVMTCDREMIEGACRAYRSAPSIGSNRLIRSVETRYLAGRSLSGAFWQQGAIEFYQRYLSPDRAGMSHIAEPNSSMWTVNVGARRM